MDEKKTANTINKMLEGFKLTQEEVEFINYSKTGRTDQINHSQVTATFILAKQLKLSTSEIIQKLYRNYTV